MRKMKASAFIKTGTCLRYLIDVREGSAIGRAWPDPAQSENDFVNSRMEKIHENANVLDNLQKVDDLLKEIGFADVRKNAQEHLKKVLIPAAIIIMNQDSGRGKLTTELAKQISDNAREIRKGVVEAADGVELYDEFSNAESWPSGFRTELLWPIPWWILLAFVAWFGAGVFFAKTPLYEHIKELLTPAEQVAPATKNDSNKLHQEEQQKVTQ